MTLDDLLQGDVRNEFVTRRKELESMSPKAFARSVLRTFGLEDLNYKAIIFQDDEGSRTFSVCFNSPIRPIHIFLK